MFQHILISCYENVLLCCLKHDSEMSKYRLKYLVFLLLTTGKCPDFSSKMSSFVEVNTVGNHPHVSFEILHLFVANTAGKCPNVSFKILVYVDIFNSTSGHFPDVSISTFVATNTVGKRPHVLFCCHWLGWKCPDVSLQISVSVDINSAGRSPNIFKMC